VLDGTAHFYHGIYREEIPRYSVSAILRIRPAPRSKGVEEGKGEAEG